MEMEEIIQKRESAEDVRASKCISKDKTKGKHAEDKKLDIKGRKCTCNCA